MMFLECLKYSKLGAGLTQPLYVNESKHRYVYLIICDC